MSYIFYLFKWLFFCVLLIPSVAQAKLSNNQCSPLIVLLHGLNHNAASFDTMKQRLAQAIPTACILALTSVEGMQTVHLSIQEQAEAIFKELSSRVEDLGDRAILLIGHSQGGLRAYALLKQYAHILNIKGLVTLATPWEGAPGARVDPAMLSAHLTVSVLNELRTLSLGLGYAKTDLEKQLMLNVEANQAVCRCPGGKDLMTGSTFLSEVEKSLPYEEVPILAIGAGQSDFSALLTKKKAHYFKDLNALYAFFVVGEKYFNGHHDMQVPLYSQHALHIVPKRKKNFRRVFIKDAFHGTHVWTIPVPKHKAMLAHPCVLHRVIKFAKSIFK